MEYFLIKHFLYLVLITVIWLGILNSRHIVNVRSISWEIFDFGCGVLSLYFLENSNKYIPVEYDILIIWSIFMVATISLLLSFCLDKKVVSWYTCWKAHPYMTSLCIILGVTIIWSIGQGKNSDRLVLSIMFLGIMVTFICAWIFGCLLNSCGEEVWKSNLISLILLQGIGYFVYKNTSYYWLIVYCLLLGQGVSLSIGMYMEKTRKTSEPTIDRLA